MPAELLARSFRRHQIGRISERLRAVADAAERELGLRRRDELTSKEKAAVRSAVKRMYRSPSLRASYKGFFDWLGKPELFKAGRGWSLEYSDVYPLIYLRLRRPSVGGRGRLVAGRGDQTRVIAHAECVKLCKSYPSSYEITRFAQSISPDAELIAVERHGEQPLLVTCRSAEDEERRVWRAVEEFATGELQTMAIICKTQSQAARLHRALESSGAELQLLTSRSVAFRKGIVVCTSHLAKGLEFDEVVVPRATSENYGHPSSETESVSGHHARTSWTSVSYLPSGRRTTMRCAPSR